MKGGITILFVAKNEDGVPSWKLVQLNQKTVTRRLKPLPIGKDFAVQPGRGKYAVCRGEVTSCMPHQRWMTKNAIFVTEPNDAVEILNNEAHKEGFGSWAGLMLWFEKKGINIHDLYRIEFKLI